MAITGKKISELDEASVNAFKDILGIGEKIIDVTYDELLALMDPSDERLVPGQFYRITDYRTVHWVVSDTDGATYILDSNNDKEIITGDLEPLIVLATSENTLDVRAYSETHPEDIIEYQIDLSNNYDLLAAFYDTDHAVDNFKGLIVYRIDTSKQLQSSFDWRVLTYEDGSKTFGTDCVRCNIKRVEPGNGTLSHIKLGEYNFGINVGSYSYSIIIGKDSGDINIGSSSKISIGEGSYCLSIGNSCGGVGSPITIGNNTSSIIIEDFGTNITIADDSSNVKIGQGSSYIELGDSSGGVSNIDIGQGCGGVGQDIVIGGGSYAIKIGDACHTLQFGEGVNDVDMSLDCNTITLGDYASGISFEPYCINITLTGMGGGAAYFGSNCNYITIGEYNWANIFGTHCSHLILPEDSINNVFENYVKLPLGVDKDFTDSSVVQITDGSQVTHRMCGTKIVGTYLEEQSDGSFVEVHAENIIGVSV